MRAFACARRRFIAPASSSMLARYVTSRAYDDFCLLILNPLSPLLSPRPYFLFSQAAHCHHALLSTSCSIYVPAKFVSCLRYNRRAITLSPLFFTNSMNTQPLLEATHNGPHSNSRCSGVSCSIPRSSASLSCLSCGESGSGNAKKLTTRRSSALPKK